MRKRFGEIATFSRGLTFSKGDVVSESSKRVLRSNNIDLATHSLVFDDIACLKEGFIIPDDKMLHRNDIFICMSNGSTQHLGKVAFISEEIGFAFGGFMGAIHPDESQIFPKYAFYACLSSEYRRFLSSIFNGININNLKWSDLSDFRIPTPPLAEQERIVAELDLLQGIIDKQKAQLKELDTLARSIFYDMFGDPVQNEKGWKVNKLGDVLRTTSGGTPSKEHPEYYENGTIPWVNSGDLHQMYIYDVPKHITQLGVDNSSAKLFPVDTVLVAMYGATVGETSILKIESTTNQAVCGIFPGKHYLPTFLYCVLIFSQAFFIDRASGGAQPNISQGIIKGFNLISPSMTEQQSFATKIEAIERQKASINTSIAETQKLFDYTMDKYFG